MSTITEDDSDSISKAVMKTVFFVLAGVVFASIQKK